MLRHEFAFRAIRCLRPSQALARRFAAEGARAVVVADVHAFPGHITCDGRSASEIVVPVFGRNRELLAVLDIDSEHKNAFDEVDRRELEELVRWFQR